MHLHIRSGEQPTAECVFALVCLCVCVCVRMCEWVSLSVRVCFVLGVGYNVYICPYFYVAMCVRQGWPRQQGRGAI